jgi:hypothetical protein
MTLITTLSAFVFSNEPTQPSTLAAARPKPRANTDVRESYNVQISSAYHDKFKAKFQEFHDKQQCFGEELAREAYQTRSEIKQAHQAETSMLGQMWIWARNRAVYGASNVGYDYLSKNKNPEEIVYSAFKTGGADLGLKSNGFSDTLELWHAIKHTTPVYPEDITPTMVNEYKAQVEAYKTQVQAHQVQVKALMAANPTKLKGYSRCTRAI